MSAERDVNRIVRSWIRTEEHESADRVLQTVLSRLDSTPQRRPWWPSRRFVYVNKYAQAAIAAAAVLVVAVVGYNLLPRTGGPGGPQTAAPTAQQTTSPSPSPVATSGLETVTITPFAPPEGFGMCPEGVSSDCAEDPRDDSMAFTVAVPDGWEIVDNHVWPAAERVDPPGGALLLITRGSWLYSEPCRPDDEASADIPVGPTVADFATALDAHPLLDVTTPVDVTLAGYSGKYLELQGPADIGNCVRYRPIDRTIYSQGPADRWRYWILDVEGVRVVIGTYDLAGTSAQHQSDLQAMVDSIQVTP